MNFAKSESEVGFFRLRLSNTCRNAFVVGNTLILEFRSFKIELIYDIMIH